MISAGRIWTRWKNYAGKEMLTAVLQDTAKDAHLVSSSFVMVRPGKEEGKEEILIMGDCAINIDYQDSVDKEGNVTVTAAQKLAEVAIESAKTAKN